MMNIYPNPNVGRIGKIARAEQEVKPHRVGPLQKTDAVPRSDSVDLSTEGKLLSAVRRGLDDVPDIRFDKVNALKKAIQDGTYRVPADKIAEAMIREGKLL